MSEPIDVDAEDIDAEDAKLVTLARSARVRNSAPEGAAVRDDTGRTYVATTIDLPSLHLSALQAAVVMAVASGAGGLEAATIVSASDELRAADRLVVADLTSGVAVFLVGLDGVVRGIVRAAP